VPGKFFLSQPHNCFADLIRCHPPDIYAYFRIKAGKQVTVGGEPETGAALTKRVRARTDKTDTSLTADDMIIARWPERTVGNFFKLIFLRNACNNQFFRDKLVVWWQFYRLERHSFDKAHAYRAGYDEIDKAENFIGVYSGNQNGIELYWLETGGNGSVYTSDDVFEVANSCNFSEGFRVKRIEADVNAVEAGSFELCGIAGQQSTIRGKCQVVETWNFCHFADKIDDTAAHQRFAAANAHLLDAALDSSFDDG
jgi:hypothetical protein